MPIHTNAYNGKVTGGTRVFCLNSNGRKVAYAVLKTLGAISPGTVDSVSYQTGLYEINVPNALTIYVECEFHDTKTGSDWIRNNTANIGEAICKGLCNYFGVTYKKSGTTTNTNKPSNSSKSKVVKSDIYYQVLVVDRWLPTVKNLNDFAGIKGKAITAVAIKASKGKVKYRVHTIDGKWLPYVT